MVIKYLFQFGFFPWNSHVVLRRYENKPYFPPRILGLEKSDSYVKYDLLQLMALFFHRSQLLVSAWRAGWALGTAPSLSAHCLLPAQCYGLWDHEDPKEPGGSNGQERVEEPGTDPLEPKNSASDVAPDAAEARCGSLRLRRKTGSLEPQGAAAAGNSPGLGGHGGH